MEPFARAVGSISAEVDDGESLSVRLWVSWELIIRREDALAGYHPLPGSGTQRQSPVGFNCLTLDFLSLGEKLIFLISNGLHLSLPSPGEV